MKMETEIKQLVAENWEIFLNDLAKVIRIPSVQGVPEEDCPFGRAPKAAVLKALDIAKSYGFETKLVNHAVGYAQFGESRADQKYIGIIGHLDVVPANEPSWDSPPFDLIRRDGVLYARGILDNKGPIMSCLFGLKLIKDLGIQPKIPIRVLFGSNEETGSQDIPLYLEKEVPPMFGFTPDCKYPVVYGERGIVNLAIKTSIVDKALDRLGDFQGQMSRSVVPSELSVTFDGQQITALGKSSPSNAPEMGINSITKLARELRDILPSGELQTYFSWLDDYLSDEHYGEKLGIGYSDTASGKLILTPVLIKKTDQHEVCLELAIRYPISVTEDRIIAKIKENLPQNAQVSVTRSLKGTNFPKDNAYVTLLSAIYGKVTGLDATPVTTTGATYARYMPNTVAFGPSFPGQKGIAHKENEYFIEDDLKTNLIIYALAIYELCLSESYQP
ncbi:peptidase M20 [Bacilli bacterium]|nr:peptidase M20 [Bacilli bacterium]